MANLEIYNFDHVVNFSVLELTEHNPSSKTADLQHCGLHLFTMSADSPILPKRTDQEQTEKERGETPSFIRFLPF